LKLWIAENFPQAEYVVVTDVAGGLNENGEGLRKLIEIARRKEIDAIVVAHRDRPTKFGFEYLKTLFDTLRVDSSRRSGRSRKTISKSSLKTSLK